MSKKKRPLMTRAFSAASRWLSNRGYFGFTENRVEHISYRCGWMAGYATARRELSDNGTVPTEKT